MRRPRHGGGGRPPRPPRISVESPPRRRPRPSYPPPPPPHSTAAAGFEGFGCRPGIASRGSKRALGAGPRGAWRYLRSWWPRDQGWGRAGRRGATNRKERDRARGRGREELGSRHRWEHRDLWGLVVTCFARAFPSCTYIPGEIHTV